MPEIAQARRIYVSGHVQGVGYRYFVRGIAERLGISGYARNLADGRVEAYAIGDLDQLESFTTELWRGPRHAIVERVDTEVTSIQQEFSSDFVIE
jgi:acylphosphatase